MASEKLLTRRFARLFAGLERSHGRYIVPPGGKAEKGKLHSRSWASTVHAKLTEELFDEHLKGIAGLGVVPIRDDATCVFGAIDVDPHDDKGNYVTIDIEAILAEVLRLKLPLIPCRSKSGGAHLYLFLSEPVSAELVRAKLMEWSVLLHPSVEVFPKQTRLASDKDDGSWINLPYFAGDRTTRYAVGINGSLTLPEFLDAAEAAAVPREVLESLQPALPEDDIAKLLEGAPPCLQTLARKGFGDWQNNGLFNLAVYLRKRYGDGWAGKLDEYNRRFMVPPVPTADVTSIIKSVSKKMYSYMCKQEPICGVCNRQVCLTREYGVGGMGDDPGVVFGELVKIETKPPTYIWDVDGARLELDLEDMMDQRRFHKVVFAELNKWPSMIRPQTWHQIVKDRLNRVEVVDVPEDATKEGQFWAHVNQFCTSKVRGKTLDELLLNKPFTDAARGRTFFRSSDLFQYLAQHRFVVSERDAFKWLRKRGVEHHFDILKGRGVNFWSVPAFPEQTEDFAIPHGRPQEKM